MTVETRPANVFSQLWAIATLTVREASRRKVFSVLILFGVALMSSMTFFSVVDMESRLRLLELWSTRVSSFFAAIVAIILAGFSLPGDFEQKRIYLLASKPLSKITYFLGKYLGFALLLALFFGIMGFISVAYIRIVELAAGSSFPPLQARPRVWSTKFEHEGDVLSHPVKTELRKIEGDKRGILIWEFRDLRPPSFGPTVALRFRFVIGHKIDTLRFMAPVHVRAATADGAEVYAVLLRAQSNEWMKIDLPSRLVKPGQALRVMITTADDSMTIIAKQESVFLFEKSELFEWNFLKGIVLMLFQALIVMSITLMGTTFLSAPVSILLGGVLYLMGSIHGFVAEGVRDMDVSLKNYQEGLARQDPRARTPEDLPPWLMWYSSGTSKIVLKLVPDFETFDFSKYLLGDLAVSARDLAKALVEMSIRAGVLLLIGLLAMLFRDFG